RSLRRDPKVGGHDGGPSEIVGKKSSNTPRGNTGHLHQINPKFDRTYHRNLPFHTVPDSISDSISVSVHSVQYTDLVHYVALSNSEHSENSMHYENMDQPPTPP
ncbi:hypothetical protein Lal_00013480, partial [Lupinus albus]